MLQFPHLENTFDTFSLTISAIVVRIKQHKYVKMLYKYNYYNEPSLILSTLLATRRAFIPIILLKTPNNAVGG